jgi:hypothetical protein
MGTIGTTRLVYGEDAELMEDGLTPEETMDNFEGELEYDYENAVDGDSMIATPMSYNYDVVPLIVGGGFAYVAHSMYSSKKYSWAYILGGFTLGYVVGNYVSKGIYKIAK